MKGRGPVALVGLFGVGNFGNEATLEAILGAFAARHVRDVVVIADTAEPVRATYGVRSVPISTRARRARGPVGRVVGKVRDAGRALTLGAWAGALVLPGTGIFEGIWVEAGGLPLTLFLMALAARTFGRPVQVVAAGIDLTGSGLTRQLYGATLRLATSVSVRDEPSADAAQRLGLRRRPPVVPDQAFALTVEEAVLGADAEPSAGPARHVPRSIGAGLRTRPRVVVGVMDYRGRGVHPPAVARERYLDAVTELVVRLLDGGCAVHLVPGSVPDIAPMRVVGERVGRQRPDGPCSVSSATTYRGVTAEMAGAGAVTASRYHTVIGGLTVGVPAVPFGYGPKHDALVTRFGLARGADIDTFEPAELAARVLALAAQHEELTVTLRAQADSMRVALSTMYDELVSELPGRSPVDRLQEVAA